MIESPSNWNGKLRPQLDKAVSRNKGQARKPKGKNFKRPAKVEGAKTIKPVHLYLTECHNALGKKAPVVKRGQEEQKKVPQHLGAFRCTECGKPAKVRRTLNTDGVEVAIAA